MMLPRGPYEWQARLDRVTLYSTVPDEAAVFGILPEALPYMIRELRSFLADGLFHHMRTELKFLQ